MAVAEWFFLRGRHENGPFTIDQLASYYSSGTITEETYLWRPGCRDWFPLAAFEEFAALLPQPADDPTSQHHDLAQPVTERSPSASRESPALANARQWADESPHPWRRYFARYLDLALWTMIMMILIGVGLTFLDPRVLTQLIDLLTQPGIIVAEFFLAFILAMIPNAILIGLTGGNLGKWLFGVRVLDDTDRPMGLARAFKREARVFFYGLGLGMPVISLITMFIAYQKLKEDGGTSWDQAAGLKVVQRRTGAVQFIGSAVGIILLIVLVGGMRIFNAQQVAF